MTTFLPREVREGLDAAFRQNAARRSRLRVQTETADFRVLRLWANGFSVDSALAPRLRGLVDIYDGSRHLCQCLIVAASEDRGEMCYEFKRNTAAHDRAPLDFPRDPAAPVALLPSA